MGDYSEEDVGNIVSLEHVNVQIPDQSLATLFYVVGLGCTRDPYLNVGLNNMWANIGEQQFHLPTRSPQVIDGYIGLVVPHLEGLAKRLEAVAEGLKGTEFSYRQDGEHMIVTCPWGNRYRCHGSQAAAFGDMASGIPYVEFAVPRGAMAGILRFYHAALGAPTVVESDGEGEFGRVKIGRHQSLLFRETDRAPQTLRRSPYRNLCGEFFHPLRIFAKPRRHHGRCAQPSISFQSHRRPRRRQSKVHSRT